MRFTRAVLLDLDGVLIDTQDATARALAALATAALGRVVDPTEAQAHVGRSPAGALAALGVPDPIRLYDAGYDLALRRAVGQVRVFKAAVRGMAALVEETRAGVGLVTSQARRRLPLLLPTRVAALAHVVVTGDEVTAGKPDPEGILAALAVLGVAPGQAMYIGDTPGDLIAARAAGVLAVGAGWGYTDPRTLRQASAQLLLTHPTQLGPWLLAHLEDVPAESGRPR